MSIIVATKEIWQASRQRTQAILDEIEKLPQSQDVLGWRPGPGRAHIAWQLMHIGVTEELFATERLLEMPPSDPDLCNRFRGGSTPDDDIPSVHEIRTLLDSSRTHLEETLTRFSDDDLPTIPEPLQERGWSIAKVLHVLAWHEPHHQGQAHLTLNIWKSV